MRPRYVLVIFAAVLLVILALANGTGAKSSNLAAKTGATPVPGLECEPQGEAITPIAGTNIESSGTVVPNLGTVDDQTIWLVKVEVDSGKTSPTMCFVGFGLFRIDSGTVKITFEAGGCAHITSAAPASTPSASGCPLGEFGPGDTITLHDGDVFFGNGLRIVVRNDESGSAVLLVSDIMGEPTGGCGRLPCP